MLQCNECEFFIRDELTGRIALKCDPFSTIKEPACLQKMQLMRMEGLVQMYQTMLNWNQKLAPMQEQMFEYMKREMNDIEDSDSWKYDAESEEDYNPAEDSDDDIKDAY
ncbi:MAG: hypothetical protein K9M57_04565 [Phycisphaerae bacterium]|nr:hypothetical protein [Phycisphaerae bacterium]